MSNDIITTDLQSLEVESGLVELFELDLGDAGTLFFYPGLDSDLDEVRFYPLNEPSKNNVSQANEYMPLPISIEGIESRSEGASNKPTLTIANVGAMFRTLLEDEDFSFDDVVGYKIIRRRTLQKYLVGGSAAATPFEFPVASFIVDRVASENNLAVSYELAPPFDVNGIKLPGRVVVGKYCSWQYQGATTGGIGGCFFDKDSKALYGTTEYDAFFDIKNRPLVSRTTLLTASTTYSGTTTYGPDSYVSYNGKYWRAQGESVVGSTPSETNVNWIEVFGWTTYSGTTTYAAGSYVKHSSHIWKSAVSSNLNNTPVLGSKYWSRQDICSKTLEGCKCRFQFVPATSGLPSATKATDRVLPFGAFPGSVKFK